MKVEYQIESLDSGDPRSYIFHKLCVSYKEYIICLFTVVRRCSNKRRNPVRFFRTIDGKNLSIGLIFKSDTDRPIPKYREELEIPKETVKELFLRSEFNTADKYLLVKKVKAEFLNALLM